MPTNDLVGTDVNVNWLIHDLGFVKKCFHWAYSDECTEFIDFRNGPFNDLLVIHAEENGVELDALVNGAIPVDDSPTTEGLVVVGDQNEAVF